MITVMKIHRLIPLAFPVLLFGASVDEGYFAYASGDYNRSFELLRSCGLGGRPGVSFLLGKMYLEGLGTLRNEAEGVRLLSAAADGGHSGAAGLLMDYYAKAGEAEKALRWYRRLPEAERKNRRLEAAGLYRLNGENDRAFAIYRQMSNRYRVPEPTYEMGRMYENGEGRPVDIDAALMLYRAAAKKRYEPAEYRLGLLLAERCREEARTWLERVAYRFPDVPDVIARMRRNCPEQNLSE